jgi:hypothetical protein
VALRQTQQIVEHQHLAVAIGPRTNADGGNTQLLGNARGNFALTQFLTVIFLASVSCSLADFGS